MRCHTGASSANCVRADSHTLSTPAHGKSQSRSNKDEHGSSGQDSGWLTHHQPVASIDLYLTCRIIAHVVNLLQRELNAAKDAVELTEQRRMTNRTGREKKNEIAGRPTGRRRRRVDSSFSRLLSLLLPLLFLRSSPSSDRTSFPMLSRLAPSCSSRLARRLNSASIGSPEGEREGGGRKKVAASGRLVHRECGQM